VGDYDDKDLELKHALSNVETMASWFTRESKIAHSVAPVELSRNPTWAEISNNLATFLDDRVADDVVIIYAACHGEEEANESYLLGRDSPRRRIAGRAIAASQIGQMIGSCAPGNFLVILDTCVSGVIASTVIHAATQAAYRQNSRYPDKRHSVVAIASAFGFKSAGDGAFVSAFLKATSNERWTGTTDPWIPISRLMAALKEEIREFAPWQRPDQSQWGDGGDQLIPNPNVGRRRRSALFDNEEFAAHFDPASRGISRGESGFFFAGRLEELKKASQWLAASNAARATMLVITGSPGTGKSALLSRIAVLSRPDLLPPEVELADLPPETVPPDHGLDGVVWCHGKSSQQVIAAIAGVLQGSATTPEALVRLAQANGAGKVIAIDALDEAIAGEAEVIARSVLVPLVKDSYLRLMIATRRHAIGGARGDLLDALTHDRRELLDLDLSAHQEADMCRYVEARLKARDWPGVAFDRREADIIVLARKIASAANKSFLVSAIAARSVPSLRAEAFRLPTEVGEALAGYLDRLSDARRIYDVLRALAWAQGGGLPWGTVWPAVATSLAAEGIVIDDTAIASALDVAGDLVVELEDGDEPVYRLFHEALAEHLRASTPRRDEAPQRLGKVLLALRAGRRWSEVPHYVRRYLPAFLNDAEMVDELQDVLLDAAWARQRRADSRDPLSTTRDVEAAAALFWEYQHVHAVALLCHQYSRAFTQAVPALIQVLALSGQHRRADALAANLTDVADRMVTYQNLARIYAVGYDSDGARACAIEVKRALPTIHADHRPMAWYWVVQAETAAGMSERARQSAAEALEAVGLNDPWDRPNGLFWAAMAARIASHVEVQARVRLALEEMIREGAPTFRNQFLQAASVAGCTSFLRVKLAECLAAPLDLLLPVRIGNLALALVDAGMADEMTRLVEHVGKATPRGEPDSVKRWVWALALSGRWADALDALDVLNDPLERSKAIQRIASVVAGSGDAALIERLDSDIQLMKMDHDPLIKARLILARWTLGQHEPALAEAEKAMAANNLSAMIDPRAEQRGGAMERKAQGVKTGRRAMVESRAPIIDQGYRDLAAVVAARGDFVAARAVIKKIEAPRFKAEALSALARSQPQPYALDTWMEAMIVARRAGRGEVKRVLDLGFDLMAPSKGGGIFRAADLKRRVEDTDAAWELELFIGEYAALRTTMAAGRDRTRLLTNLMVVPRHLAQTRSFTEDEVRLAWDRGEDGSRLFALGLMRGNPDLGLHDILAKAIRTSRSAFEQYHALAAVDQVTSAAAPASELVLRAIKDEIDGVSRTDGSQAWLKSDSDRRRLASQILERA